MLGWGGVSGWEFRERRELFFCLIALAFSLSRLWRRTFYPFLPSALRAVAARCKLPFAIRPGLSRERRERGEERRAEAKELGAAGELGAGEELPLFLPTPSFMASTDED